MATGLSSGGAQEYQSGARCLIEGNDFLLFAKTLKPRVERICFQRGVGQHHVDDIVQETWLSLKTGKTYDPGRGSSCLSYATGIARNMVRKIVLEQARFEEPKSKRFAEDDHLPDEDPMDQIDAKSEPLEAAIERLETIKYVLSRLKGHEREMLKLHVAGLLDKEIALRLSISHEAVRTRKSRLLNKMRKLAKEQADGKG